MENQEIDLQEAFATWLKEHQIEEVTDEVVDTFFEEISKDVEITDEDKDAFKAELAESAASETLHPDSGSNGGAASRTSVLASIAGALANVDRETANYWEQTLKTNFRKDFGTDTGEWAKNKDSIKAYASKAVGKTVKEDIAEMFSGQKDLTEDFKTKATVIFEAAVQAKVNEALVDLEDQYEERLEEEVGAIAEELENKTAVFLEHVADVWMEENEVAIENGLRNQITTEFMSKLRDLFIESNVNIPEQEVEVIDALANKVEELEARLAEVIEENAELRSGNETSERDAIIDAAKEGMTDVQKEKLDKLAEGVDAESAEEFTEKMAILAESVKGTKPAKGGKVQDLLEEADDKNRVLVEGTETSGENAHVPAEMAGYIAAIQRTVPSAKKAAAA